MHHGSERGNAIHVTTGREAHRVVRKLAYLPWLVASSKLKLLNQLREFSSELPCNVITPKFSNTLGFKFLSAVATGKNELKSLILVSSENYKSLVSEYTIQSSKIGTVSEI